MTAPQPANPDRIVFIPGYGEDPDLVRPFTQSLAEAVDSDVVVADLYRRNDHNYYPDGLPSGVLAQRLGDQLRQATLPPELTIVAHSAGARVAAHFPRKRSLALLAPEGIEQGGRAIVKRFAGDIARRALTGSNGDQAFAIRQIGNLLKYPGQSLGFASEIASEPINPDRLTARMGVLAVGYKEDNVIPLAHVARAVEKVPKLKFTHLEGGHYAAFHHPEPTVMQVAQHIRAGNGS